MRKWAAWIIALVMAFAAGCAFGETKADLYDLYDSTENGRTWAGNAVPVLPGVAVMSPAGMHGEPSALEIWNGADYTPVTYAAYAANEKLLVLISDPEGTEPGIPERPSMPEYSSSAAIFDATESNMDAPYSLISLSSSSNFI